VTAAVVAARHRRHAVEMLVDLAVYAPIGLLSLAREHLDELTERGRGRVDGRIELLRRFGESAVRSGRDEVRRRVDTSQGNPTAPARSDAAPTITETAAVPTPVIELPIEGYEHLAASQIVERLASLDPAELDAVEAFELAHRNRRTIHGRIAQLRASR
jgi:hypothetical protein